MIELYAYENVIENELKKINPCLDNPLWLSLHKCHPDSHSAFNGELFTVLDLIHLNLKYQLYME